MSLISHVRQKIDDKNTILDNVHSLHAKLEELRAKVETESKNQNIDTSNFATKEDFEEIIKDLKDCFNDILEVTPRNNIELEKLKEQVSTLEKLNASYEERFSHLEAFSKLHIEEPIEKGGALGATIRIPKIKIEKTKK